MQFYIASCLFVKIKWYKLVNDEFLQNKRVIFYNITWKPGFAIFLQTVISHVLSQNLQLDQKQPTTVKEK